jgi:hypothetical protein
MHDFTAFQDAIENMDSAYIHTLISSLSLALEEFYKHLQYCGVSSITGEGINEFLKLIETGTNEYER